MFYYTKNQTNFTLDTLLVHINPMSKNCHMDENLCSCSNHEMHVLFEHGLLVQITRPHMGETYSYMYMYLGHIEVFVRFGQK